MEKLTIARFTSSVNTFVSKVEQYFPDNAPAFYNVVCFENKVGGVEFEPCCFEYTNSKERKTAYKDAMLQHIRNIDNIC